MAIVTYDYRPKRAPRKKRPAIANRIVTPAKLRSIKGPVIRLRNQANDNGAQPAQPKRSAIVTPKRRSSIFGTAPDPNPEELKRAGEAADALWRELVRRATGGEGA